VVEIYRDAGHERGERERHRRRGRQKGDEKQEHEDPGREMGGLIEDADLGRAGPGIGDQVDAEHHGDEQEGPDDPPVPSNRRGRLAVYSLWSQSM
jgi:hypothetical protein